MSHRLCNFFLLKKLKIQKIDSILLLNFNRYSGQTSKKQTMEIKKKNKKQKTKTEN